MNWRLLIGATADRLLHATLSRPWFPLLRAFPRGLSWYYDLQRFANRRDFKTLLDVGANTGQTVAGMVQYFPNAQIHSFEPSSGPFAQLKAQFGQRQNVRLESIGLGAEVGSATIYLRGHSTLNTMAFDAAWQDNVCGTETVPIDTVDAYCERLAIDHVDVLKMDVQGWEMNVLAGAKGLLERGAIQFIYTEVTFRRDYADMQYFSELNDHLITLGFHLCGFYEIYRDGAHKEIVRYANVLYIHVSGVNPD